MNRNPQEEIGTYHVYVSVYITTICIYTTMLSTFMFDVNLSEEIDEEEDNYVNAAAWTVDKVAAPPGTFHTFNIVKHEIYSSVIMFKKCDSDEICVFKSSGPFFCRTSNVSKSPLTVKSTSLTQLSSSFSLRPEVSLLLSVFSTDSSVLADTVSHHGPSYPL